MKVLHIGKFFPPHKGGIESHLQALCGALRGEVDLQVVVSNVAPRTVVEEIDGVRIKRMATWLSLASAPIGPGLIREIRKSDADIVHIHFPHPAAILAWLASGHRAPLVVTYHSDIVRQKALGAAFSPFLNAAASRAAAIIATSPSYIDSSPVLTRHRARCAVIPLGIAIEEVRRFDPILARDIRARHGGPLILAVGRLVPYKGFAYLIDAMRSVDARLLIVGDGPLRSELTARAARAGCADKVVFLGGVDDVRPYYEAADIFVLPSITRAEAFGLVQLEAMAHAKPVVNTSVGSGVTFASPDGETGLTVPPADPAALAAAINRLLHDGSLRAALGQRALERVRSRFTVDEMAAQTLALYRRIVAARGM